MNPRFFIGRAQKPQKLHYYIQDVSVSLRHGIWLTSQPGFLRLGLRSGEPIKYRFCGNKNTVEITGCVVKLGIFYVCVRRVELDTTLKPNLC
jgi:hypothetical protein